VSMAGRVECKEYGEGIICEHGREKELQQECGGAVM
jgi:hypothetical protein